jgi:hypothetical protein
MKLRFFGLAWPLLCSNLELIIDRPQYCCIAVAHTILLSSLRAKALRTSFARSLSLTIGWPICTCTRHVVPRPCTVFTWLCRAHSMFALLTISCALMFNSRMFVALTLLVLDTSAQAQSRVSYVWDLKVLVWCKKYPAVAGYFINWGRFGPKFKWRKDLFQIKIVGLFWLIVDGIKMVQVDGLNFWLAW